MIERSAAQAYEAARLQKRNVKMVRYEHLAQVAHSPQWFYLAEVIPTSMPLSAALALRQQNEDVLAGPSAVTTSAPEKAFSGKRVVKSKNRKNVDLGNVDGLATARMTRGKKIKLPAGEGGGPEDDFDEEDEDFEEEEDAGGADSDEGDAAPAAPEGGGSHAGANGAAAGHERMDVDS
ncbi:hypothetical protein JCM3774_005209 [Rhodotorula dairenensis]